MIYAFRCHPKGTVNICPQNGQQAVKEVLSSKGARQRERGEESTCWRASPYRPTRPVRSQFAFGARDVFFAASHERKRQLGLSAPDVAQRGSSGSGGIAAGLRQALSFAAQALSVRHDGLLARRCLNGKRPPLPSAQMNMHRRVEKLPLRWYNEHGFIWFCPGKQMRWRG